MENINESDTHQVVVLEGTPLGRPTAKRFSSAQDAESFVESRVRANVSAAQRDRFEKAIIERIVSEDGQKAVSEVIAGKLAFLQALAKAYAPARITLTTPRSDDQDSDDLRR